MNKIIMFVIEVIDAGHTISIEVDSVYDPNDREQFGKAVKRKLELRKMETSNRDSRGCFTGTVFSIIETEDEEHFLYQKYLRECQDANDLARII